MKKKIAVLLTAIMMLSCSTMFLANPSVDTKAQIDSTGLPAGAVIETAGPSQELSENLDFALEVAEQVSKEDANFKAEVVSMIDIKITGVTIPEEGLDIPVKNVANVKAGDTVVVLHILADGTDEVLDAEVVADGEIIIKGVKSFSPFYIMKVTEVPAQGVTWPIYGSPAATPETTLPKTGAPVVLPFAALACVAGAVVCGRKAK